MCGIVVLVLAVVILTKVDKCSKQGSESDPPLNCVINASQYDNNTVVTNENGTGVIIGTQVYNGIKYTSTWRLFNFFPLNSVKTGKFTLNGQPGTWSQLENNKFYLTMKPYYGNEYWICVSPPGQPAIPMSQCDDVSVKKINKLRSESKLRDGDNGNCNPQQIKNIAYLKNYAINDDDFILCY